MKKEIELTPQEKAKDSMIKEIEKDIEYYSEKLEEKRLQLKIVKASK